MKIVYVYPQFAHLAGTERVLIDKMNYFSDMDGVEVFMVTYEQGAHRIPFGTKGFTYRFGRTLLSII